MPSSSASCPLRRYNIAHAPSPIHCVYLFLSYGLRFFNSFINASSPIMDIQSLLSPGTNTSVPASYVALPAPIDIPADYSLVQDTAAHASSETLNTAVSLDHGNIDELISLPRTNTTRERQEFKPDHCLSLNKKSPAGNSTSHRQEPRPNTAAYQHPLY